MEGFERHRERYHYIRESRSKYLESSFWVKRISIAYNFISRDVVKQFSIFNYSDVYSLCVAYPVPFADRLYQETKEFLENHVENFLVPQVAPTGRIDEDHGGNDVTGSLLHRYYTAWNEYSEGITYLNYLYQ